jgi:hypothetical protein
MVRRYGCLAVPERSQVEVGALQSGPDVAPADPVTSQELAVVRLVAVEALPQYHLRVVFSDGVEGEVDLSDLVGQGVFSVLSDPEFFAQVSIGSGGEIAWGDKLDICPDAVYLEVTGKSPQELFPNLTRKGARA